MNKIISMISLCRRAGKLVFGFDMVKAAMLTQKAYLIILASDISTKTEKEIYFIKSDIPIIKSDIPMTDFNFKNKVAVMAVTEKGFADNIKSLLNII